MVEAVRTTSPSDRLSPVVRRLLASAGLTASAVTGTGAHGRVTRGDVLALITSADTTKTRDVSLARTRLSPVVRKLAREHRMDPSVLVGTGVGGRVTKVDMLEAIAHVKVEQTQPGIEPVANFEDTAHLEVDLERGFPHNEWGSGDEITPACFAAVVARIGSVLLDRAVAPASGSAAPEVHLAVQREDAAAIVRISGAERDSLDQVIARIMNALQTPAVTPIDRIIPRDVALTIRLGDDQGRGLVLAPPQYEVIPVVSIEDVRRRPVAIRLADGAEAIAIHTIARVSISAPRDEKASSRTLLNAIRNGLERRPHQLLAE